jgi:hypothetical protein
MGRALAPDKLKKYETLEALEKRGAEVKIADFGKKTYDAYRKWQRDKKKKQQRLENRINTLPAVIEQLKQPAPDPQTVPPQDPQAQLNIKIEQSTPEAKATEVLDMANIIGEWHALPREKQLIYEKGYYEALRPGASAHHSKIWTMWAKMIDPGRFCEKDRKATFTPEEYAKQMRSMAGINGSTDKAFRGLVEDHIKLNNGITPEAYEQLKKSYEEFLEQANQGGAKDE